MIFWRSKLKTFVPFFVCSSILIKFAKPTDWVARAHPCYSWKPKGYLFSFWIERQTLIFQILNETLNSMIKIIGRFFLLPFKRFEDLFVISLCMLLWIAFKIVSLQYQWQLSAEEIELYGVVNCFQNSIFAISVTTHSSSPSSL